MWFGGRLTRRALASSLFLSSQSLFAEDWPNFRGPRHDGISHETGLIAAVEPPLKQRWEAEVGSAFSSFAVVDGRVYTAGTRDEKQVLVCFDAESGKQLWQVPIEKSYFEAMGGSGPRATPTIAAGRVYMMGAHGRLVCVDAADGRLVWDRSFKGVPQWGYSGSVLVDGGRAIVAPGGRDGSLLALDAATGKEVWKAGTDKAGYSTPYPFEFEGRRYIVGFAAKSALIVHADSGKLALTMPWHTDFDVNAASPIFHEGRLFIGSGYDTGSAVFKLSVSGDSLKAERAWTNEKLLVKFQSCLLIDGHLYVSDQSKLKCVEWETGKELWSVPRIADSTIAAAAATLYLLAENGELHVAPASPKEFKGGKARLFEGRCWAVPVISGGRLYVRNLETIRCFQLQP